MSDNAIFNPFLPGENLSIKEGYRRNREIKHVEINGEYPGRVHFSLLDYTEMNPPQPGGGGIGISCHNITNKIHISSKLRTNPVITNPSVLHMQKLFAELVNNEVEKFSILINEDKTSSHSGFGSTVTRNTAVFSCLNTMFGKPFSDIEMFDILTHNYVEDNNDKLVHWGFDTGVGEAALLFGGFVCVNEVGEYIGNISKDGLYIVMAKGNMEKFASQDYINRGLASSGETGVIEAQINESVGMIHQRKYGDRLIKFFYEELIGSFLQNNYKNFKNKIWKLNHLGTFKRMQMSYNPEVMLNFEKAAKRQKAVYAGISSAGPAMFAIFSGYTDACKFMEENSQKFLPYLNTYTSGSVGGKITIEPTV